MIDQTDFSLPEDPRATPEPPALPATVATPPAPLVVIQYRGWGLLGKLTPPLMIVLATIVITGFQRTRPLDLAQQRPKPASVPTVTRDTRPEAVVAAPPAVPTTEPAPQPPAAPASAPVVVETVAVVAEPVSSPFEFDPADRLVPVPGDAPRAPDRRPFPIEVAAGPSALPGPAHVPNGVPPLADRPPPAAEPGPADEVTREEVLEDIQRQAAETQAQREELADLKPRARAMLVFEAVGRVNASRAPFRNELREALAAFGPGAGPEIERLCLRYGRETIPETNMVYRRAQRSAPARMTRVDEVNFMRACGLPEPVILDSIAHKLHSSINTRGGPRDPNEVRVRAARMLLAVPLPSPRTPAATATASATVPAPGPARVPALADDPAASTSNSPYAQAAPVRP